MTPVLDALPMIGAAAAIGLLAGRAGRRRPRAAAWLLRVRPAPWVRWSCAALGSLLLVASAIVAGHALLHPEPPVADGLALALTKLSVLGAGWSVYRTADLVVTSAGLHLFFFFLPWHQVEAVEVRRLGVRFRAPARRTWRPWTEVTAISDFFWEVTPGVVAHLCRLHRRFGPADRREGSPPPLVA